MNIDQIVWDESIGIIKDSSVFEMAHRLNALLVSPPDRAAFPTPTEEVGVIGLRDADGLLPWLALEATPPIDPDLLLDLADDDGTIRVEARLGRTTRAVLDGLPEWEP